MAEKPGSLGSLISKDRLKRALGRPEQGKALSPATKTAIFFAAVFLLATLVAWVDPRPSLRHVQIGVLSGSPAGNYHAVVEKFADEVLRRKGRVTNVPTAGSAENIRQKGRDFSGIKSVSYGMPNPSFSSIAEHFGHFFAARSYPQRAAPAGAVSK